MIRIIYASLPSELFLPEPEQLRNTLKRNKYRLKHSSIYLEKLSIISVCMI
ncbi:hypothetical protein T4A_226 [Trichinella pseudospiralis]|uniref:Uncharacterized protein n=1 Tax=Trichinella pseudospiralis TaxID=6337 RepID=A0A0V1ALF9_TRIPS|nr:hypothetical protein T4A_226 [Trichinella pseudospiralis]